MKTLIALLVLLTVTACSSLTIEQQHMIAKRNHNYISDQSQYGLTDAWKASLTGDCEDYALWMRERVGGQLMQVRTQDGQVHMVLNVDGMIVDNLSYRVYPIEQMQHKKVYQLKELHISQFMKARGLYSASKDSKAIQAGLNRGLIHDLR